MTNEEKLENMCSSLDGTEIIVGTGHAGKVEGPLKKIKDNETAKDTAKYFKENKGGDFFWADPLGTFNRTTAAFKVVSLLNEATENALNKILILSCFTSETAEWYEAYREILPDSKYALISQSEGIKGKEGVIAPGQFESAEKEGRIEFITFPELEKAMNPDGSLNGFKEVKEFSWDMLVVDAPYTSAFASIKRAYSLYATKPPERGYLFSMSSIPESLYNSKEERLRRDLDEAAGTLVVPAELEPEIRSFYKKPGDEDYLREIISLVQKLEDAGVDDGQITALLKQIKEQAEPGAPIELSINPEGAAKKNEGK